MAALSIQQQTLIVQLYFQNNNSVTLTQRAFTRINGPTYIPARTVRAIKNKFQELEPLIGIVVEGLDTEEAWKTSNQLGRTSYPVPINQ